MTAVLLYSVRSNWINCLVKVCCLKQGSFFPPIYWSIKSEEWTVIPYFIHYFILLILNKIMLYLWYNRNDKTSWSHLPSSHPVAGVFGIMRVTLALVMDSLPSVSERFVYQLILWQTITRANGGIWQRRFYRKQFD